MKFGWMDECKDGGENAELKFHEKCWQEDGIGIWFDVAPSA